MVEVPPLGFIPKIEQNPDLRTFLPEPLGTQGWLRPNHLHPPFNNKKARKALLHMMDQMTYLGPLDNPNMIEPALSFPAAVPTPGPRAPSRSSSTTSNGRGNS